MALSSRRSISALALVLALAACRRGEDKPPERAPPGDAAPIADRTFAADAPLMFVYADLNGRFEHATARADVPEASRKVVRVIEPTVTDAPRGDYDDVWVTDLRAEPGADGIAADVMSRLEFEARALAALPPGRASSANVQGAPPEGGEPLKAHDQVIIYGTTWCGACRQARTYLTQAGIAFVDKDIEQDPSAAAELQQKARRAGIPADRVPIIDVRGRLMVGFDPSRLSTLLGDRI